MFLTFLNALSGKIEEILVSQYPCKLDEDLLADNMSSLDIGLHHCPRGSVCKPWAEGPNSGLSSFDDIAVAFVTVFQVMTLEGWSGTFYLVYSEIKAP